MPPSPVPRSELEDHDTVTTVTTPVTNDSRKRKRVDSLVTPQTPVHAGRALTVSASHAREGETSTPNRSRHRTPVSTGRVSTSSESYVQASKTSTPNRSRQRVPSVAEEMADIKKRQQKIEKKMDNILLQNEEILKELKKINSESTTQKRTISKQTPVEIKSAVHDGQKSAEKEGYMLMRRDKKWTSEENRSVNDYIRIYVKGLYPSTENGVIDAGIQTYFQSHKQKEYKRRTNKEESHRKGMTKYGRKSRKLQWRLNALKAKNSWDSAKKAKIEKVLKIEHMSSEDEKESGDETVFVVRPLSWRSSEFGGIIKELDEKAKTIKSSQSRRQEIRRVTGSSPSVRSKPTRIEEENSWAFL